MNASRARCAGSIPRSPIRSPRRWGCPRARPDRSSTMDVGNAVRENKAGKIEYKVDKAGIIHAVVGKKSFDAQKIVDNAAALIDAIVRAKPASAKGIYLKKITISTTMGPGIRIDPAS